MANISVSILMQIQEMCTLTQMMVELALFLKRRPSRVRVDDGRKVVLRASRLRMLPGLTGMLCRVEA
jgi:hypothetical protein